MGLTPHEHAIAARLAREGYTTLVLGYTKRTSGAAVIRNEQLRKLLEQTVVRGWRILQEDPMADANHTAVIGFSLGGYFATYVATAVKESPPKAVVNYYGVYALAEPQITPLRTPLLVLQGENDEVEFVNNARRLKAGLRCNEKVCEVVFYPAAGHQFDLFEPGSAATRDAWERTVRFLRQHLSSATTQEE
jgi:dienelactone hydrolase